MKEAVINSAGSHATQQVEDGCDYADQSRLPVQLIRRHA